MPKYKKYDLDKLIAEALEKKMKRIPPPTLTPEESWSVVEYKMRKKKKKMFNYLDIEDYRFS